MSESESKRELAGLIGCEQIMVEDYFPCTAMQEGFMAVTNRGSNAPIRNLRLKLEPHVNLIRLRHAIEHIVGLSDVLRARIINSESLGLIQVVLRRHPLEWTEYSDLESCMEAANGRTWKLGEPLARYAIVNGQQGHGQRWFVWTVHHAIYDGWSFSNLAKYAAAAYDKNGADGISIPTFKSFVTHVADKSFEAAGRFWGDELAGLASVQYPALPTLNHTPVARATVAHHCPPIQKVKDISRTVLLRSALSIVLANHTGSDDVCFGTVVSGRNESVPEVSNMLGCTIATVPVRLDLKQSHKVSDLLAYASRKAYGMAPFEQFGLHNISRVSEEGSLATQFQTLLVVQPPKKTMSVESSIGTWRRKEAGDGSTSYALTIQCYLEHDGIDMEAWYDDQVIQGWQAERLLGQVALVAQQLASNQDQPLWDVQVALDQDLEDIWRLNTTCPTAVEVCLHDLIAETIRRRPEAQAVSAWDGDLTYTELDVLSDRLAAELICRGVGPEVIVPLVFEKSMWTPVAVLAVMKAGGASVTVDITQPRERLETIVQQVSPHVVLCSTSQLRLGQQLHSGRVLAVDRDSIEKLGSQNVEFPRSSPSNAAYVVFTSGTTGTPKGAVITHANISTFVTKGREGQLFTEDDRVVDFASYAFDVAWSNFASTLTVGACLCIPSEDERRRDVHETITKLRGTYIQLTPTVAKLIDPATTPTLKKLSLGGENFVLEDFRHWMQHVEIIAIYAPAECTVAITKANVSRGDDSLGYTFASNAWVVSNNKLCPIGAIGELWVEGPTVSRGYHNQPARTQEAYIQDPMWLLQGLPNRHPGRRGRLYKTGDLVRQDSDGKLTFMTRRDGQVKIRGQRVEMGEVEQHVRQVLAEVTPGQSHVTAETVTLKDNVRPTLVAFVTRLSDDSGNPYPTRESHDEGVVQVTREVGQRLSTRVPAYMVPTAYVPVHDPPLGPTGKSDRRVLKAMLQHMTIQQLITTYNPSSGQVKQPTTPMEEQVRSLWAKVLGMEASQISIDDHFVRLGGDSIDAMRLVSMARVQGLLLSAVDLLRSPQLCEFAKTASAVKLAPEMETRQVFTFYSDESLVQDEAASMCSVAPDLIDHVIPCTPLQEGLFALTARRDGDYITKFSYNLRQDVDISRFSAAWEYAVAQLPLLRTRIVNLSKWGLAQVVLKHDATSNTLEELPVGATQAGSLSASLGQPLSKAFLRRDSSSATAKFELLMHHAVYDGWSVSRILDALARKYEDSAAPVTPVPFAPFVKYARDGADSDITRQYWADQFQGLDAQQYPSMPSPDYHPLPSRIYRLDSKCSLAPGEFTMSTAIRTAWAILVGKHSGSHEAVFGAVVNGRQASVPGIELIEDLAGPTAATVPVRVVFNAKMTIEECLRQVQEQATSMIAFEQAGVQNIRKVSDAAEQACQFQSLVIIHPPPRNGSKFQDLLELAVVDESRNGTTEDGGFGTFALELDCFPKKDGIHIQVTFDPVVISEEQIRLLTQRFDLLLEQICSQRHRALPLSKIKTIVDQDLDKIWQWNAHVPAYIDGLMHHMIESTAKRIPGATAVHAWNGLLTYSQVDNLATRLAIELLQLGVGPEVIVPVIFEKSMWTPVVMLAVMKTGAASVLLDITQPLERLRAIVRQVDPIVAICSRENEKLSQQIHAGPVFVIDQQAFDDMPETILDFVQWPKVDSTSALYIVFTSGSTGVPKGVVITHGNFATAIQECGILQFGEGHRVFDFASYAFDVSWSNMLNAFSVGATLCVPSEDDRRHDIDLAINKFKATYADLTPTVAKLLHPSAVPSMKVLNIGGEYVCFEDFRHWFDHADVLVTYGPTECTVCVTCAPIGWGVDEAIGLGHTFGTVGWIVDPDSGELCPVGSVGELWLEGPLVGRGYLNDPVKTQAVFVEDPEWLLRGGPTQPGRHGRLYKTGDLVRYNADGGLTFIGRKDSQVKIRGQRIELGEVEHHVRSALIAQAAVETTSAGDAYQLHVMAEAVTLKGSKQASLIAFISLQVEDESSWTKKEHDQAVRNLTKSLERRLSGHIPVYMIPAACIPVHGVALTTTGKTDRRKLRELAAQMTLQEIATESSSSRQFQSPANAMESQLVSVWAQVLGRNPSDISTSDNFFSIGGNSIDAMRLVAIARQQGLSISVADIFRSPQLSDLAALTNSNAAQVLMPPAQVQPLSLLRIADSSKEEILLTASTLCGIGPEDIEDILPCTPLQEGLLALTARRGGDYIAHFTYELADDIDLSRFRQAWKTIVSAIPVLRTRVVSLLEEGLVQVILRDDISSTLQDSRAVKDKHDNDTASTLLGESLTRAYLDEEDSGGRRLVWSIHHALYDGWSLPKMLDALAQAYKNPNSQLTLTPFVDFIQHVKGVAEEDARKYWEAQFDGLDAQQYPRLPTPSHHPQTTEVRHQMITPLELAANGFSASTTLRAAWAILSARDSGMSEVVFGAVVSGRQAAVPGIENVVGPTLATVPVRVTLDPDMVLEKFLQNMQKQATDMIPFEQTGLQNIRQVSEEAEEACKFQSLLTVQPAPSGNPDQIIFKACQDLEDEQKASELSSFGSYGLAIDCFLQDGPGVQLQVAFDPLVVPATKVERMCQQFEFILQQLCSKGITSTRLGQIQTVTGQDLTDIWRWNTKVPSAAQVCVHDIIASTVDHRPDSTAICAWDGALTYRELDSLATRLASKLVGYGVGPEVVVPLAFEKSMWTPVAMMAVMKAGGASVALDVTQPIERLAGIVGQVKPRVVLASTVNEPLAQKLFQNGPTLVVDLENIEKISVDVSQDWPAVQPNNALYVVFTSGSTGTPKGVVITHSNFSTAMREGQKVLRFSEDARIFDFASYSFDVSWSNVLNALTVGACLCVPSDDERRQDLGLAITKYGATWVELTPTVAKLLQPSTVPSLKVINLSGEAVDVDEFQEWLHSGTMELLVTYGPSECTITTSCANIHPGTQETAGIGHAIGACSWVVNDDRLCPVGSVGELWLEGPLVGRGYLNDPEKTNKAFIEDPEWLLAGATTHPGRHGRLYKTGDLVKYNADGALIFMGRIGSQVKVRGQRVELGEVEHHVRHVLQGASISLQKRDLKSHGNGVNGHASGAQSNGTNGHTNGTNGHTNGTHAGDTNGSGHSQEIKDIIESSHPSEDQTGPYHIHVVAEAAVLAGKTRPTLIAFITLTKQDDNSPWDKKDHDQAVKRLSQGMEQMLLERVPSYMVPAVCIPVYSTAIAATGKTDRRKLRELVADKSLQELAAAYQPRQYIAPQSQLEHRLLELWSKVLGMDPSELSANDHFFRLGGDSIDAMRLVGIARKQGMVFTVPDIFQMPRLCDLAGIVETELNTAEQIVPPFSLLQNPDDVANLVSKAAESCNVPVELVEDVLPCTALQQGLLALTARRNGDYIAVFTRSLQRGVEISRLEEAWKDVVAAIPILRTRIVNLPTEGLVQVVLKEERAVFDSRQIRSDEVYHGSPLLTTSLIPDPVSGGSAFSVQIHHALYDGWSLDKIFQTLEEAYDGVLLAPQTPFGPFVKYLKGIDEERMRKYWHSQFEGIDAQVFPQLPTLEHHPEPRRLYRLDTGYFPTPQGDTTLSTAFRAAWAIVAAEGSSEAVFGAVTSGRQAPVAGIDDMVGPTIATVPLRVTLDPDMTIEDHLQKLQRQTVGMVPFEQAGLQFIRRVSAEAEQGCNFQSLLVVQPGKDTGANSSRLFEPEQDHQEPSNGSTKDIQGFGSYSLMVDLTMLEQGLQIQVAFDPDVVREKQVQRFSRRFELVLRQICSNSHSTTKLGEIQTVVDEDLEDIWKWNAETPPAVDKCLHDLIAKTIDRRYDFTAIEAWDGELTYGQLDVYSRRLAAELLNQGVGPEVMVPLLFEKSVWMSVAMVAVMRAGGAAVALDTTQPLERLRTITGQVGARVVITSKANRELGQQLHNGYMLTIDLEALEALDKAKNMTKVDWPLVTPSNTLCAVFTSGSTGKPKGVTLTHRNLATAITCHCSKYGVTESSRLYDFASYSFDFAWSNLLLTLISGGCLCVPSESERRDDLVLSMARFNATFGFFTPALVRTFKPEQVPTLRTLLVGGEKFRAGDIPDFGSSCQSWNIYGPAETTVIATTLRFDQAGDQQYTIGRGLAMNTWIVDGHGELCPVGAVGELWLEGPLVSKGYLNNPEKTAESFVKDPQWLVRGGTSGQVGRRGTLYKTGDLVKYDSDGSIIFVGRRDNQVKIRGQRVELLEVDYHVHKVLTETSAELAESEQAPNNQDLVNSSSIGNDDINADNKSAPFNIPEKLTIVSEVVQFKDSRNHTLVVFISLENGDSTWTETEHDEACRHLTAGLEERLAGCVPAYMVPSTYIPIHVIPMTPTGKWDRKRLREIASKMTLSQVQSYVRRPSEKLRYPTSTTERELEAIWRSTLNITDAIDLDSDFFRVGGDSITAMQIASAARARGLLVSVRTIMKERTIGKIASVCKDMEPTESEHATMAQSQPNQEEALEEPFPLSPIQQWFVDLHPEANICFDICFLLELTRDIPTEALHGALAKVISRHSMLRSKFHKAPSGAWMQRVTNQIESAFRLTSVSNCNGDALIQAFIECRDAQDIETGLMTSAVHVKNEDKQLLFLTVNHLVSDLVSFRVIFKELEDILSGAEPAPIYSLNFQKWCSIQREAAKSLDYTKALNFTLEKEQFDYWGLTASEVGNSSYTHRKFALDDSTTTAILGWVNDFYKSEPMELMMAATMHAFATTFPDRALPPVYTEGHGREPLNPSIDISQTVSWFTTMCPVQLQRHEANSFSDMVQHTMQILRGIPLKGWSYFASRYLNEEGKKFFAYEAMEMNFNYLGVFQQLERSSGLLRRVPVPLGTEPESAKKVKGLAVLEVTAVVRKSQLEVDFLYDQRVRNSESVERWIMAVKETMIEIVKEAERGSKMWRGSGYSLLP
ncbi:NRPS [Amphichorda felina]